MRDSVRRQDERVHNVHFGKTKKKNELKPAGSIRSSEGLHLGHLLLGRDIG